MTRQQADILKSIEALPEEERRELLDRLLSDAPSYLDSMSPAQRAELHEGLKQADAGEVVSSDELKRGISTRFGFTTE